AGRNFGYLYASAVSRGYLVDRRPDALCDIVTLRAAFTLGNQIHLKVCDVWTASQKVMPHKPVEVVRRSRAHVHLIIGHLGNCSNVIPDLAGDRRGLFERRAFGHIDDHLKLALVIEREHLHLDQLQREERHCEQQQQNHTQEESKTPATFANQSPHHFSIQLRQASFFGVVTTAFSLEQSQARPRRDQKRNDQRKHHRRGRSDRYWSHVRTHQSA